MRSISVIFFTAAFISLASASGAEPSCDHRKCMSVCRSDFEPDSCAGMCGRIISLCRRLVPKPRNALSARAYDASSHKRIGLDARARSSNGEVD